MKLTKFDLETISMMAVWAEESIQDMIEKHRDILHHCYHDPKYVQSLRHKLKRISILKEKIKNETP